MEQYIYWVIMTMSIHGHKVFKSCNTRCARASNLTIEKRLNVFDSADLYLQNVPQQRAGFHLVITTFHPMEKYEDSIVMTFNDFESDNIKSHVKITIATTTLMRRIGQVLGVGIKAQCVPFAVFHVMFFSPCFLYDD
uniref:Uncharacterized protein n=1 Tax=Leersia perrieri TaxID=77586 RepID=A0A0D9VM08_9ORYZ